jgi:hypothetical protein
MGHERPRFADATREFATPVQVQIAWLIYYANVVPPRSTEMEPL